MKVLILGKGGQLASELSRASWSAGMEVHALSQAELDIANAEGVKRALQSTQLVINAAAYTAVDRAESNSEPGIH